MSDFTLEQPTLSRYVSSYATGETTPTNQEACFADALRTLAAHMKSYIEEHESAPVEVVLWNHYIVAVLTNTTKV